MRISLDHLRSFCDLPERDADLRLLLDDVGIEVKRMEEGAFALELLANRGDHRCYAGVAREVIGRRGGALRLPATLALQAGAGPEVRLQSSLCLVYTATPLEIPDAAAMLPAEVVAPIHAAGQSPVSGPVDATNLSNLELGQPTHVFDADTIVGPITIREARAGEKCRPLFSSGPVDVPVGACVIADDEKILAVAGVIGCEESKVTATTRRIVLESACFDPVAVRKAGRAMAIQTDSSARFERGSDPEMPLVGAGRVAELLVRHLGARVSGPSTVVGAPPARRSIALDGAWVRRWTGVELSDAEIAERLERLGFSPVNHGWQVPPWRVWDVATPEDLAEELARSVGYNAVPRALPGNTVGVLPSAAQAAREGAEDVLLGLGFSEVITNGFHDRDLARAVSTGEPHVQVLNALEGAFSLLKNNALAQALEGLGANLRFQVSDLRVYEFTRTFHPGTIPGEVQERAVLWALANGPGRAASWQDARPPAADVWLMKGLVEEMAGELRLRLSVDPALAAERPVGKLLHAGRRAAIVKDGRVVGVFGEVDPEVVAAAGIKKARPVYLEIDQAALERVDAYARVPAPGPRPPSVRSLAYTLDHRVEVATLLTHLRGAAPEWMEQARVVDEFSHGDGTRTLTVELSFNNDASDRSADAINAAVEALLDLQIPGIRRRA